MKQLKLKTSDGEIVPLPEIIFSQFKINFSKGYDGESYLQSATLFEEGKTEQFDYEINFSSDVLNLFSFLVILKDDKSKSKCLNENNRQTLFDTLKFCHFYIEDENDKIFCLIFIHFYHHHLKKDDCIIFFQYHLEKKQIDGVALLEHMQQLFFNRKLNIRYDILNKAENFEEMFVSCLGNISLITDMDSDIFSFLKESFGYYFSNGYKTYYLKNIHELYVFLSLNEKDHFKKHMVFEMNDSHYSKIKENYILLYSEKFEDDKKRSVDFLLKIINKIKS